MKSCSLVSGKKLAPLSSSTSSSAQSKCAPLPCTRRAAQMINIPPDGGRGDQEQGLEN